MSEVSNITGTQSVTSAQPTAADPTTAAAAASSNGEVTSSTKIGSLEELRRRAPKVYNAICQGIAENICEQMKKSQERIKRLQREGNPK